MIEDALSTYDYRDARGSHEEFAALRKKFYMNEIDLDTVEKLSKYLFKVMYVFNAMLIMAEHHNCSKGYKLKFNMEEDIYCFFVSVFGMSDLKKQSNKISRSEWSPRR